MTDLLESVETATVAPESEPAQPHADLLVITPTRGRPDNVRRLIEAWDATQTGYAALYLCIDNDDPTGDEVTALWHEGKHLRPWLHRVKGPRKRLVEWTNEIVAMQTEFPCVASFGDDHVPALSSVGWDAEICTQLAEMGTGFVYPDDGYEHANLPTAVAMTADIPLALGWMALPTSRHLYIDHVWRDLGQAIGRYRYLPDVLIEHLSTYNGKADEDDTSRDHWSDEAHEADERAYIDWCNNGRDADIAKLKALL